MTKKHFEHAAAIVRAILAGEWTNEPPTWADNEPYEAHDSIIDNSTRAVQTAEVFIYLFLEYNPRFNRARFLRACGFEAGE